MLSSEDARQDCERFYPATKGRTHVVHFAIENANRMTSSEARAVADHYGLPESFFFLPGQFWAHKNHETVIEALRILQLRGIRLVVVASGLEVDSRDKGHFPRLTGLIKASGLEENLVIVGMLPHDHVLGLMHSCAAMINPSAFQGWSTTVEEAKAVGTPLILSSLRVHKEQAGNDAQYFDCGSAQQLASILEAFRPLDPEERRVRSETAAAATEKAVQRFADEFCDLVELVAGSGNLDPFAVARGK